MVLHSEYGTLRAPYLRREQIAARVTELGAEIAADYDGLNPLLVAPLGSTMFLLADLAREISIPHATDVVQIGPYTGQVAERNGERARMIKNVDVPIAGRHVLVVEALVDTGLTLHFVTKTLTLQKPASLTAVALLDRPYRRLIGELALRYVGFTVPDELFAGYGLGPDERWRRLPDLHLFTASEESVVDSATPYSFAA
jgi:hypoxanthine phosphoribosyltransferase